MKLSLHIPPHLRRVATLPCEYTVVGVVVWWFSIGLVTKILPVWRLLRVKWNPLFNVLSKRSRHSSSSSLSKFRCQRKRSRTSGRLSWFTAGGRITSGTVNSRHKPRRQPGRLIVTTVPTSITVWRRHGPRITDGGRLLLNPCRQWLRAGFQRRVCVWWWRVLGTFVSKHRLLFTNKYAQQINT